MVVSLWPGPAGGWGRLVVAAGRRAGHAPASSSSRVAAAQTLRTTGGTQESAIVPVTATSCDRPRTVTVAVALTVSSPRDAPASSGLRTASSISRWVRCTSARSLRSGSTHSWRARMIEPEPAYRCGSALGWCGRPLVARDLGLVRRPPPGSVTGGVGSKSSQSRRPSPASSSRRRTHHSWAHARSPPSDRQRTHRAPGAEPGGDNRGERAERQAEYDALTKTAAERRRRSARRLPHCGRDAV